MYLCASGRALKKTKKNMNKNIEQERKSGELSKVKVSVATDDHEKVTNNQCSATLNLNLLLLRVET